jgi:hypothetical protein
MTWLLDDELLFWALVGNCSDSSLTLLWDFDDFPLEPSEDAVLS